MTSAMAGTHNQSRTPRRPRAGCLYPCLIEVSGRCPPEDCGGPWGYAEMLEAIADPKHERHADLTEWIGDDFDPRADQAE